MRKFSLLLITVCLLSVTFAASDEVISDANSLASAGYISDHSANTADYHFDAPILRQESIGIITKINGTHENGPYTCQHTFSDVSRIRMVGFVR